MDAEGRIKGFGEKKKKSQLNARLFFSFPPKALIGIFSLLRRIYKKVLATEAGRFWRQRQEGFGDRGGKGFGDRGRKAKY